MDKEKNMAVVAGASEIVSIHRLEAIEWVKEQAKTNQVYSKNFTLTKNHSDVLAFIEVLRADGNLVEVTQYDGTAGILKVKAPEDDGYVLALCNKNTDFYIYAYCVSPDILGKFVKRYGKSEKRLKLNWWYPSSSGDFDERDVDFNFDIDIQDSYYPFIDGGLRAYFNEYMTSQAPILLLMGEPGTGKTTFIRHLINEHNLETVVTYDEKVMEADYFYCQFLTDESKKLMVIEDADLLLRSREEGSNKTMNKLLNVSQGIIQLGAKKIVFSTNIENLNKVDPALVRPGRCFDVLEFRKLSFAEAQVASKAAGLPDLEDNKEYALSEIFNRREHQYRSQRIGFR